MVLLKSILFYTSIIYIPQNDRKSVPGMIITTSDLTCLYNIQNLGSPFQKGWQGCFAMCDVLTSPVAAPSVSY